MTELSHQRPAGGPGPARPVPGAGGALYERRVELTELPVLILSPHARCNCRCVMCDIWKVREPAELSPAETAALVPDLLRLGTRHVVLTGGEPLMHSDLAGLCRPLRQAGIGITLLSTGLLLGERAADVASLADEVIVSLDGPRDVHDAIRRVPRAFERLAEGVARVRERVPDLVVSARCTVQRRNFRHLVETVDASRGMGLHRVSFLAADVSSTAFHHPEGWRSDPADDVAGTRDDLLALAAEIDRLERERAGDLASGFVAEGAEKLRRRVLGPLLARAGLADAEAPVCNAPWVSAVIEPDGSLRPCYFHPVVANVREAGGLLAALSSARASGFRRELDVATDETCRRCVCSLALRRPEA